MRKQLTAMGLALGLTGAAWGHIDSLRFDGVWVVRKTSNTAWTTVGGQVFSIGQVVTIGWRTNIQHDDNGQGVTTISYSTNGTAWTSFTVPPLDNPSTLGNSTYQWTVAQAVSTTAKIRIYQNHPLDATVVPLNVNDNYNLVTANFTVQPASPILSASQAKRFSLRQNPGSLVVDFLGFANRSASAEICNFNGSVLRVFHIQADAGQSILPTASLPMGEAVFRLMVDGEPTHNQVLMLRR